MNPILGPLLITNAGVLIVLLFGPNSPRQLLPVSYGGAAIAIGGAYLLVRALLARRRRPLDDHSSPTTKAV